MLPKTWLVPMEKLMLAHAPGCWLVTPQVLYV
jgi:hypothetical protein